MFVHIINTICCVLLLLHNPMLVEAGTAIDDGFKLFSFGNFLSKIRRRLSDGRTVITSDEMDTILQNCIDTNYDVALYSSLDHFHFFIGITVTETTTTVDDTENTDICVPVPLGFESLNGDKRVVRTTTDEDENDDVDGLDGYQKHNFGSYKLGDIIEAFNTVDAIPVNEYDKITNNCVHFAQNIWRNLQVTEDPTLHSFLVSSVVNHNYFIDYAREYIGLSPFLSNIMFGSKNTKIPAHYILYVEDYFASQLIMDSDVIGYNQKGENDEYYYNPNHKEASLLKLLDGRKLVDDECADTLYNADAVIITFDDGKGKNGVLVGILLEPINNKECPWYLITTEQDNNGKFVKAFTMLERKLNSFDNLFYDKTLFLTISIGQFTLDTLSKSFETASAVGTGLPDDAQYNIVHNHGAELNCNMVTDLGLKVKEDTINLIKSSINVGAPTFSTSVQSEGPTLTDIILDCLGERKSPTKQTKSSKRK